MDSGATYDPPPPSLKTIVLLYNFVISQQSKAKQCVNVSMTIQTLLNCSILH